MTGSEFIQYIIILLHLRRDVVGFQLNIYLPSDASDSVKCQDHLLLQASTTEYTIYNSRHPDGYSILNSTFLPTMSSPSSACTYNLISDVTTTNDTYGLNVTKIQTRMGSTLSLTCGFQPGQISVTLFGPGMVEVSTVEIAKSHISIKLTNIQFANEGVYSCKDIDSYTIGAWSVSVLDSLIVKMSSLPTCNHYEHHKLTCNASDDVLFENWEHRRGNITLRTLSGSNKDKESTLELSTCGYQDTGTYVCRIKDITGEVVENEFVLRVYAPPVITNKIASTETRAIISVQYYSEPVPSSIQWRKEGKRLSTNDKYIIENSRHNVHLKVFRKLLNAKGFLATLNISDPSTNDFGEYMFLVENKYGRSMTTIHLNNPQSEKGTDDLQLLFQNHSEIFMKHEYTLYIYIAVGLLVGLILIFVIVVVSVRSCKLPAKKESNTVVQCVSLEDLLESQKSSSGYTDLKKERQKKRKDKANGHKT